MSSFDARVRVQTYVVDMSDGALKWVYKPPKIPRYELSDRDGCGKDLPLSLRDLKWLFHAHEDPKGSQEKERHRVGERKRDGLHTLQIPAMSLRSARSSSSTTSSLDSTFSDISGHASSTSSSSPPNSKTNAFFASPFSTRSPSPSIPASPPPANKQPSKPRSLTADFFATPIRAPSPPASSGTHSSVQTVHASRIFPSRYTSSLSERRTPEFSLLEVEVDPFHAHRTHARNLSSSSSESSSASASSSFTSSFPRARLPTPPPSPLHRENTIISSVRTPQQSASASRVRLDDLVDDEPTPRPADREPPIPMLRFERSLLLQRQAQAAEPAPPLEDEESDTELEGPEDYEPRAGNIIALPATSQLPLSPLALTFSIPGNSRRSSTSDLRDRSGDERGTLTPKNEDLNPTSGSFTILSPSSSLASSPSTDVSSLHPASSLSLDDNHHLRPASIQISSSTTTSRGLPSPTASIGSNSHDRPSSADLGPHHLQLHHSHFQHQYKPEPHRRKPQLRLLRSLGHGAFSAVWLAEDLSQVPLTLVSRRSVRDLRRMASGKEKGGGGDRERDRDRRGERSEQERTAGGRKGQRKESEMAWNDRPSTIPVPLPVPAPAVAPIPIAPSPEVAPVAKSPRPTSKLRGLKNMLSFSRSPNVNASSPPSSLTTTTPAVSFPISPVSPAGANAAVSPVMVSSPAGDTPASSSLSLQPSISRASSADSHTSGASTSSRLKWNLPLHLHAHSHLPSHPLPHYLHPHTPHNDLLDLDAEHGALVAETETASLERDASLRKFRARVRGTRPPASLGRVYLDERDGEMGEPRTGGGVAESTSHDERRKNQSTTSAGAGTGGGETVDGGGGTPMDVDAEVGLGASLSRNTSLRRTSSSSSSTSASAHGRLVAVKMTPRRPPRVGAGSGRGMKGGSRGMAAERARERQHRKEEEERTRVGFVREVEVLKSLRVGSSEVAIVLPLAVKAPWCLEPVYASLFVMGWDGNQHISHPNITPLLAHLSSSTHHILVLPYLPGGDLLGLVNNDVAWGKLSEAVLRRIWCELCKAVGWMHGVGLVHRDIKLENILLTAPTFSSLTAQSPVPTLESLPPPPMPFIKLTDFGLSRFVEIDANGDAELLSTRCGSEAYAAPELVTGGAGPGRGVYDARKTDAWACGVVLYALIGRQLPFGEGVAARVGIGAGGGSKIGGERGLGRGAGPGTPQERRHWLIRIARGEWEWPGTGEDEDAAAAASHSHSPVHAMSVDDDELVGPQLVKCRSAKRIVTRLLVRDPKKRARIADLWDDRWMSGAGDDRSHTAVPLPGGDERGQYALSPPQVASQIPDAEMLSNENTHWDFDPATDANGLQLHDDPASMEPSDFDGRILDDEEEEDDEVETDGCLFDQEGIDSITRPGKEEISYRVQVYAGKKPQKNLQSYVGGSLAAAPLPRNSRSMKLFNQFYWNFNGLALICPRSRLHVARSDKGTTVVTHRETRR
ncbi:hypothetical protein D9619_012276 [Psilocybe cf. subviscida]|uniref:Protein kinase domain-containing protein n=1 Tax=Psilocybe cf. subviscida TaxID=2480587 RepID=A0A8H5EZD9_9AGAR|nr:hypothetical protein D9619_012276 [Psilocybe cf. subviscida]